MDYGSFIGSCLIGGTAALAVFFPLGAKRRVRVPPIVWWLCLIVGGGACVYGLSHSTAPSYATQITAIGKAYDLLSGDGGDARPVGKWLGIPVGSRIGSIRIRGSRI
jgi:hypothetical protein